MAFKKKTEEAVAVITPANLVTITIQVRGTAPLVQAKFSQKAREKMMRDMATPRSEKKSRKDRPPRDYDADFLGAQHFSTEGWVGIPCTAFRAAMIDACRTVGLVMVMAKMALKVLPDGFDADGGWPLVRIQSKSPPERTEMLVRNDDGSADIRVRPMWRDWRCAVTVEFDADMITASSIVNLLDRAGRQVGVQEGRPFSKKSVGQGWGTFCVVGAEE